MQTLILTFILSLTTYLTATAQNTVEVLVTNFGNEEGKAMVGLYNSEKEFLKKPHSTRPQKS